jgi:hypothetical protein
MTEEDDVVVAEGSVRTQRVDGGFLNLRFCDVDEHLATPQDGWSKAPEF